ncbi:ORF2 [torque teno Delphinidae virus 56]
MLHVSHSMGCSCGDAVSHFIRCLRTHIEEDDGFGDEVQDFELGLIDVDGTMDARTDADGGTADSGEHHTG